MLHSLASHNQDISRLIEKGYAISVDSNYLVVRDIPYLDNNGALQTGAIVSKLTALDGERVGMEDHQIFFCGSHPHELNGTPIRNLGGGPVNLTLKSADLKVERSFSNKPASGVYKDWFEKIDNYVTLFSGPAIAKYSTATPYTFRVIEEESDSVFYFRDTLTSRAEIGDLALKFKDEVIAIIGLGGTGSYILDFMSKTPVKAIKGFDGDEYHVHNAYRSPGKLDKQELDQKKAEVYQKRYENFRANVDIQAKYILSDSEHDLTGVTFAFVCVDKGGARAEIFNLLLKMNIPFIDVGMGLDRSRGAISGTLRTTFYSTELAKETISKRWAPMQDNPDDIYKTNIQIAELNALNACLAVIRYKQLRGFYLDDNGFENMLLSIYDFHLVGE